MKSYIIPEYFSQNELPSSTRMNTIVMAIKNLNENLQSHDHTGTLNGPKLHATNSLIDHSLTANIFNSSITDDNKTGLILNLSNGDYANLGVKTANNDIQVLDQGIRINPTLTGNYTFTGHVTANIQGEAEVNGNPVGTVIAMIGKNLTISGVGTNVYKLKTGNYLYCNGATIRRADGYGKLIDILTDDINATEAQLPNISDNRFLKGVTLNQSGILQAAGLPNITGHIDITGARLDNGDTSLQVTDISSNWTDSHDRNGKNRRLTLDASNSNAIYGNSETVTPLNISVNYFIRY